MISTPIEDYEAKPHINWRHVDGPLMSWAGHLHWLTWGERLKLWLGRTTPEQIAHERLGRPLL